MDKRILSVTQINEYIRSVLDHEPILSGIAIQGEISNYKVYPSGHHYFTLKDENAALKCVMFKSSAVKLRFRPENGMKVIATGKISVYPRDGAYQLYCTTMMVSGAGDLHVAFEQLKAKLSQMGLFDPLHKKPIPKFPKTVGIVTSSAGAAVHDILRILRHRYPLVEVKLLPVRVQGAEAPGEIVSAIRYANIHKLVDVLIVGRGGGSIEDLWAFNDEQVAYAIYQSEIPIISAVGHEPDVTISDYVADLRAATPSNAAELVVPDQNAIMQTVDSYQAAICSALISKLQYFRKQYEMLAASPALQSPEAYIGQLKKNLLELSHRICLLQETNIQKHRNQYIALTAKLDAMSPLKVLSRGYSVAMNEESRVIKSIHEVKPGDKMSVLLNDGIIYSQITDQEESNGKVQEIL